MEITNIDSFLKYYGRIKQRTTRLFEYIPEGQMEYTFQKGKFTIGDIIRHLANIERYMYGETLLNKPSRYRGCGVEFAQGHQAVIDYYFQMHEESKAIFKQLSPSDLQQKCRTPGGAEITTWKWLRAMVEHEIHHRGQLYTYLALLKVNTPPIYGLTSEEVIERSVD